MQLAGKKLLRLLPPSENANADPTDSTNFQPTMYTVDLMDPDFEQHPRLDGALVYEAVLEPGDVLFIPEGWAHQALNMEWSLMISSNYVDQHNRPEYLEWAQYDMAVRSVPLLTEGLGACGSFCFAHACLPSRLAGCSAALCFRSNHKMRRAHPDCCTCGVRCSGSVCPPLHLQQGPVPDQLDINPVIVMFYFVHFALLYVKFVFCKLFFCFT